MGRKSTHINKNKRYTGKSILMLTLILYLAGVYILQVFGGGKEIQQSGEEK